MKKTLRLVLGDQLNHNHSWYQTHDDNIIYFMAEMRQETDYTTHHIQKIVAFFKAMQSFHKWLVDNNHCSIYYSIDHPNNQQDLVNNLQELIAKHPITKFEYQAPDEWRLDQQLRGFCTNLGIEWQGYDTEHYFTKRMDVARFFKGKKRMTMEYFYRHMRKKHQLLIDHDGQPTGGKWNYDHNNRNKWNQQTPIPRIPLFKNDIKSILKTLDNQNVKSIGRINPKQFDWPVTRQQSIALLEHFCEHLLVHFGSFQDAMHTDEIFLFHSRLSFALNTKLLSPKEVLRSVMVRFRESEKKPISIAQVEGFIRQIIGWREFMRGVYWSQMPEYSRLNKLNNARNLPEFFWTGKTQMNCLKHAITNSLDHAYAHHIQRLMITGNYALLTMTDPDQVDQWYLGVYMDAIEWVQITNTRGMSQWADGGIIATKPYVSSGSYIHKMSNYCSGCKYMVHKKNAEKDACPFNSLYWHFLDEKKEHFKDNHRMGMMLNLLHKMDPDKLQRHKKRAQDHIAHPEKY